MWASHACSVAREALSLGGSATEKEAVLQEAVDNPKT